MKERSLSLKYFLVILALVFSQSKGLANVEKVLGPIAIQNNVNLAGKPPQSASTEILISRDQYVISYNKEKRTPNWVAWKLEASQIGHTGRSNDFHQDPDLENYLSGTSALPAVDPSEYAGSCFDRGHQAPSGDRTDNIENNEATFVMSNIIPQTPYLNRVIWEHLEQHTRDLVQTQGKKVYIIAGPIYDDTYGAIGPHSDIQVPTKDFKVVVVLNADQTPADIGPGTEMISVIMPNTLEDGNRQTIGGECGTFTEPIISDVNDWQKYTASLDDIERLSGIKLFPQ